VRHVFSDKVVTGQINTSGWPEWSFIISGKHPTEASCIPAADQTSLFELAGKWVRCDEVVHLETLHVTYGQSLDHTLYFEWQSKLLPEVACGEDKFSFRLAADHAHCLSWQAYGFAVMKWSI